MRERDFIDPPKFGISFASSRLCVRKVLVFHPVDPVQWLL